MVYITFCSIIAVLDDTRIAKNNTMRRNITIDVCIRGYQHIIPYGNFAHYRYINAYPDLVPDARGTFSPPPYFLAQ